MFINRMALYILCFLSALCVCESVLAESFSKTVKYGGQKYTLTGSELKEQDLVVINRISSPRGSMIVLDKNEDGINDYMEFSQKGQRFIFRNLHKGHWRSLEVWTPQSRGFRIAQYFWSTPRQKYKIYRTNLNRYAYNHLDSSASTTGGASSDGGGAGASSGAACEARKNSIAELMTRLREDLSRQRYNEIKNKLLDESCRRPPFSKSTEDITKGIADVIMSNPPGSKNYLQCLKDHNLDEVVLRFEAFIQNIYEGNLPHKLICSQDPKNPNQVGGFFKGKIPPSDLYMERLSFMATSEHLRKLQYTNARETYSEIFFHESMHNVYELYGDKYDDEEMIRPVVNCCAPTAAKDTSERDTACAELDSRTKADSLRRAYETAYLDNVPGLNQWIDSFRARGDDQSAELVLDYLAQNGTATNKCIESHRLQEECASEADIKSKFLTYCNENFRNKRLCVKYSNEFSSFFAERCASQNVSCIMTAVQQAESSLQSGLPEISLPRESGVNEAYLDYLTESRENIPDFARFLSRWKSELGADRIDQIELGAYQAVLDLKKNVSQCVAKEKESDTEIKKCKNHFVSYVNNREAKTKQFCEEKRLANFELCENYAREKIDIQNRARNCFSQDLVECYTAISSQETKDQFCSSLSMDKANCKEIMELLTRTMLRTVPEKTEQVADQSTSQPHSQADIDAPTRQPIAVRSMELNNNRVTNQITSYLANNVNRLASWASQSFVSTANAHTDTVSSPFPVSESRIVSSPIPPYKNQKTQYAKELVSNESAAGTNYVINPAEKAENKIFKNNYSSSAKAIKKTSAATKSGDVATLVKNKPQSFSKPESKSNRHVAASDSGTEIEEVENQIILGNIPDELTLKKYFIKVIVDKRKVLGELFNPQTVYSCNAAKCVKTK